MMSMLVDEHTLISMFSDKHTLMSIHVKRALENFASDGQMDRQIFI